MKLLILFLSAVALCAGNALPTVPGDNSNYKEGDRYVWIPDGNGVPTLVDLHAKDDEVTLSQISRNIADGCRFKLFTRRNPTFPYELTIYDYVNFVNSPYDANHPLLIYVHGWNSDSESEGATLVKDSVLQNGDHNVILFDWAHLANGLYTTASANTVPLGGVLSDFLKFIELMGTSYNNMHCSGHSLGAHLCGAVGRNLGSQIGRITGLEPASPGWYGSANSDGLKMSDARYVEAIFTNAGTLSPWELVGDVNMYPNGGSTQPGCWLSSCSHSRSWQLFAASCLYNHLWGRECNGLPQAQSTSCTGNTFPMGNAIINKTGQGIYSVVTTQNWPY